MEKLSPEDVYIVLLFSLSLIYCVSYILKTKRIKRMIDVVKKTEDDKDLYYDYLSFPLCVVEMTSLCLIFILLIVGRFSEFSSDLFLSSFRGSMVLYLMILILITKSVYDIKKLMKLCYSPEDEDNVLKQMTEYEDQMKKRKNELEERSISR